ncbi:hypothetical protein GCM10009547_16730 [Sporichthya brevicatena]|uniref:ADP-ribosylglycohydrolase n=1 Tax=Sporichthya brevicatena TaxID=171442 RepID=A0ABN1GNY5_9ACTN
MAERTAPAAVRNRAAGALLGTAAGDALGAGYEFGDPMAADAPVEMRGGGGFQWAPGEWTDDTAMALVIADAAAAGDLRDEAVQDRIAAAWAAWARDATDVGVQTRKVLTDASAAAGGVPTANHLRAAAAELHAGTSRTAGNGSLMRTAPVALAYLGDAEACAEVAFALSSLTHADPEAGEACVLWSLAIRHSVLTGELDARVGLLGLPAAAREKWLKRLNEAEREPATTFRDNGWVVHALQAAWACILQTPVLPYDPDQHLVDALENCVRAGGDTDTVAAIAGGLLGACHGVGAIPQDWADVLHGWPGRSTDDLVHQARELAAASWAEDPDAELFDLPE